MYISSRSNYDKSFFWLRPCHSGKFQLTQNWVREGESLEKKREEERELNIYTCIQID